MGFENRIFKNIMNCFFPFGNRSRNAFFKIVRWSCRPDTGKCVGGMDVNFRMNQQK